MTEMLLAAGACMSATLVLALLLWRTIAALAQATRQVDARAAIQAESQRLQLADRQLADAQRLSEAAVSGGTSAVQAIHKGIAAIPFTILESIPVTRDTTRIVRASHDLISDAVYGTIKAVNSGIGAGLRAGLEAGVKKPKPAAEGENPASATPAPATPTTPPPKASE